MASILQVSIGTVNRDLSYLRQQAKSNIRRYIDERLPEEYEKCLVGLTAILREAWNTSQQAEDRREKIQALSLAKECYSMKLDLLTNATVVDDAIRFVSESEKSKGKDKEEQVQLHLLLMAAAMKTTTKNLMSLIMMMMMIMMIMIMIMMMMMMMKSLIK
jgi:hypothetical protein